MCLLRVPEWVAGEGGSLGGSRGWVAQVGRAGGSRAGGSRAGGSFAGGVARVGRASGLGFFMVRHKTHVLNSDDNNMDAL